MSKKVIPRDKSRVAHAAKQQPKATAKAPAHSSQQRARQTHQGAPNRARSAKAAPQKSGIAGFFQRLFSRFKR